MSTKSITLTLEQREDGYVVARAPGVVAARQSAVEAAVAVLTAKDIFEVAEEEVPASFHFVLKSASTPTYRRGDGPSDPAPSDVATTSDEIKRVLNKAVDFSLDAVIDGQREDGTSFEKRLVEPRDLDGLLLRTYDYESEDHRYFRIDRLTRVSIDDHEVREALGALGRTWG